MAVLFLAACVALLTCEGAFGSSFRNDIRAILSKKETQLKEFPEDHIIDVGVNPVVLQTVNTLHRAVELDPNLRDKKCLVFYEGERPTSPLSLVKEHCQSEYFRDVAQKRWNRAMPRDDEENLELETRQDGSSWYWIYCRP